MRHEFYNINTERPFKKGGRTAVAMSTDRFIAELKKFNEKYGDDYDKEHMTDNKKRQIGTTLRIIRRFYHDKQDNPIKKDFKGVTFDWENYDHVGDVRTVKGVPFYLCYAGGDWENGVYFMVYYDGKKLRIYVPTVGNPYRLDTKRALGNDEEGDDEYVFNDLVKAGILDKETDADKKKGIYYNVTRNDELMIKDFSSRLDVKKSSVSESFDRLYENIMYDLNETFNEKYLNEERDEDELTPEEDEYLHGRCDDWVRENFQKGDTIVLIEEYDYDIDAYCIGHALLKRNGRYLDVRGYMDDMEEVLEPFDFTDDDVLEFKSLAKFNKYVQSLEN